MRESSEFDYWFGLSIKSDKTICPAAKTQEGRIKNRSQKINSFLGIEFDRRRDENFNGSTNDPSPN